MGMFGKKLETDTTKNILAGAPTISVQTIPADFYGGVNPVVKFKRVEKEIDLGSKPKLTVPEKKMFDKSTAAGSGSALHPASIITNRKYLIIAGSALFLVITLGAGGYYYLQSRQEPNASIPTQPKIVVETPIVQEPVVVPTTSEEVSASTTTVPLAEAQLEMPSVLLGDSPDMDKDNLTDIAEELFGTDPGKPDSDDDTYNDGHEVFYLYNPAGKEPMKIINSGYVKDYSNPVFGYKVFYPLTWAVGSVDNSDRDILFSTITGENIELRVFDRLPNQAFIDWFNHWVPGEQYQDLVDFQTRFGEIGKNRADNLVYYFMDDAHIYVMIYHTTDSNVVNYRSVMVMMARSFRSPNFSVPEIIPAVSVSSTYASEMPSTINNSGAQ